MSVKITDVLMMKPFTEHPHQQGISYIDHWFFAMGIAYRLVTISFKFALHAILPSIPIEPHFDLQATIAFLYERNRWIENAGEKPDTRFNTASHTLVDH